MDIKNNLELFINGYGKNKGRQPNERYSSFDYCFNYFQSYREQGKIKELSNKENIQTSCLHIGFYLASWGMLRGSSFLLEKSVKYYENLIYTIADFKEDIWKIDIDNYTDSNIKLLLEFKESIKNIFAHYNPSDTLTTKIMLGVFGNVPAYDQYVRKAFSINTFNEYSLNELSKFYSEEKNKIIINEYSHKLRTFCFNDKETGRKYTKAKVVDMIGFMEGISAKGN